MSNSSEANIGAAIEKKVEAEVMELDNQEHSDVQKEGTGPTKSDMEVESGDTPKESNLDEGSDDEDGDEDNKSSSTASTEKEQADAIDLIARAVSHKDEGNELFKAGDLSKSSRSYRKGTSLLKKLNEGNTGDDQVKALLVSLQTNLSMVCFKQNKYLQSKEVASTVLRIESTNVKALYRRALASRKMGDLDSAKKDLREALTHDANSKACRKEFISIKKELDKLKQTKKANLAKAFSSKGASFLYDDKEELEKIRAVEKAAKKEAEEKATEKRKIDWENECVKRMSSGEEAITYEVYEKELKEKKEEAEKAKKKLKKEEDELKSKERAAKKNEAKKEENDNDSSDDELTEKELQMLRGYKKTSDGRTTSYFTREQTEEEKKLLGNIAPQRLSAANAPQRLDSTASIASAKSSSAWNQAGTWEEKDTSDWCNSSLTSYLKEASIELDHFTASVDEVKDLSGDASVAFVSGKKRYVFDYNVGSVKYVILGEGDDKIAGGSLKLPDISSTAINDELEVEILGWKKVPTEENAEAAVKCRDMLVNQIRSQVIAFVSAFNANF